MSEPGVIRISAAVIVDDVGQILLVRKRGTAWFMQAGGKIDAGETPVVALVRELEEELGLRVDPGELEHWGRFEEDAANEVHHVVDADAYFLRVTSPVAATAEIEEIVWVTVAEATALALAPLTRNVLLPLLAAHRPQGHRP